VDFRASRDDVRLPEGLPAVLRRVVSRGRPSDDRPRGERQVALSGKGAIETVEDAGRFEDRAGADVVAEDLRGMRRGAGHAEDPVRRAAARRDGFSGAAGAVLESDCRLAAGSEVDEVLPRVGQRLARLLLVPGEDHGEVHPVERSRVLQGAEREERDDVSALHVDDARSARPPAGKSFESLERAVLLEHRVEMADEQDGPSGARVLGDEMAGPGERRAVDPPRAKSETVELVPEDRADLADTGEIHRPAVDGDDPLQEPLRGVPPGLDRPDDPPFGRGERVRRGGEREGAEREDDDPRHSWHGARSLSQGRDRRGYRCACRALEGWAILRESGEGGL